MRLIVSDLHYISPTIFVYYTLNLVVEIDGCSHYSVEAQEKDAERDRQMRAIGLKVIRVNDGEVRKDAERIANWIIEQVVEDNGIK